MDDITVEWYWNSDVNEAWSGHSAVDKYAISIIQENEDDYETNIILIPNQEALIDLIAKLNKLIINEIK